MRQSRVGEALFYTPFLFLTRFSLFFLFLSIYHSPILPELLHTKNSHRKIVYGDAFWMCVFLSWWPEAHLIDRL